MRKLIKYIILFIFTITNITFSQSNSFNVECNKEGEALRKYAISKQFKKNLTKKEKRKLAEIFEKGNDLYKRDYGNLGVDSSLLCIAKLIVIRDAELSISYYKQMYKDLSHKDFVETLIEDFFVKCSFEDRDSSITEIDSLYRQREIVLNNSGTWNNPIKIKTGRSYRTPDGDIIEEYKIYSMPDFPSTTRPSTTRPSRPGYYASFTYKNFDYLELSYALNIMKNAIGEYEFWYDYIVDGKKTINQPIIFPEKEVEENK